MDEPRKRNPRWLLGVLVVAIAVGSIWAATALAGGGSAGNSTPPAAKPTANAPPAAKAQGKARSHDGRVCPNKDRAPSSLDV
jgi:hypothetical protein